MSKKQRKKHRNNQNPPPMTVNIDDAENQKKRAAWLQKEMEIVCQKCGMELKAVNLPQLQIQGTRKGTLEECIADFNNKHNEPEKNTEPGPTHPIRRKDTPEEIATADRLLAKIKQEDKEYRENQAFEKTTKENIEQIKKEEKKVEEKARKGGRWARFWGRQT